MNGAPHPGTARRIVGHVAATAGRVANAEAVGRGFPAWYPSAGYAAFARRGSSWLRRVQKADVSEIE